MRKEALVARAALQRLQLVAEAESIRASARLPAMAASLVSSPRVRSALAGLALLVAGRGRFGALAGVAGGVLALFKLFRASRMP